MAKAVAIIPARGGSKGIPRKNMRLIGGKPLIAYAIENALNSNVVCDVVVSSDSEEILAFASQYKKVLAMDRSSDLAQDAVTLDPVIYDAVARAEAMNNCKYDVVVTLQPTSPLLTADVLDAALEEFLSTKKDSLISVVDSPHLSWVQDGIGKIVPDYEKRKNRQELPSRYLETGAFLITKREYVTFGSRLGEDVGVYEVPEIQAIDIDTTQDWIVCEALLSRKTIVFRVDGYKQLGLGHVYRALTLAYELVEHEVVFVCDDHYPLGIEKLRSANMRVVTVSSDEEFFDWLDCTDVDIVVNDRLDTTREYVSEVKKRVARFVSFEDMGEGARLADVVVNAIYEGASSHSNTKVGKRYICLRDEFACSVPPDFSEEVNRILVMFGGTDPLNMAKRVYKIAARWNKDSVRVVFDFILGLGYEEEDIIASPKHGIEVSKNIVRVSDHMAKADMAISSQGRTTFELASMGIPTIVLAQNEREQLHTFAQMENGFINLGLGTEVTDEDIEATLEWLMGARSVRKEMRNRMLGNDLTKGISRVRGLILGE